MNHPSIRLSRHLIAAAVALLSVTAVQAATMTRSEFSAGKARISADYKADKSACAPMTGSAKDICIEQAKAKEKVARAELEHGYTGKPADAIKVNVARADGAYAVAKEKCDDLTGQPKSLCRTEAKTAHTKALADAKLATTVSDAKDDAKDDKMAADRQVAAAKCDAMTGDAQTNCMADVKARFDRK